MKINLQNYEQYFIDFIDGNLSPVEEKALRDFVKAYPHLQSELDELEHFTLSPENFEFQNKNILKTDILKDIEGITKAERLSVAFLENDIDEQELIELNQLKKNKRNAKTFDIIQQSKLIKPDIVYPYKLELKRKIAFTVRALNSDFFYRTAVVFLLLLAWTFFFKTNTQIKHNQPTLVTLKEMHLRRTVIKLSEKGNEYNKSGVYQPQRILAHTPVNIEKQAEENSELIVLNPVKTDLLPVQNTDERINIIAGVKIKPANDIPPKEYVPPPHIKKRVLLAMKKTSRKIIYKIVYSFRRNIKYKKEYLDNDKVLIAFKAGSIEYTKIKDVKKP